jgi:hypothetical protein
VESHLVDARGEIRRPGAGGIELIEQRRKLRMHWL